LEEILKDISKQVLEIKYILSLGQLLWVIPDIKCYVLNLVPLEHVIQELVVASIVIDHQMAMIQVQVGKNFVGDVYLDGGFRVNIIIEKLKVNLGLSKPNPTPYNLCMANQTIIKPLGLIKGLRILVHGIFYTLTFTVI
jgi:hypothetical protein